MNNTEELLIESIKRDIATVVSPYTNDLNDSITRMSIYSELQDLLNTWSLEDYVIVCDESNNTPETIDRGILRINVAVKFFNTNEFYYLPIIVRGDNYEEDDQIEIHVSLKMD